VETKKEDFNLPMNRILKRVKYIRKSEVTNANDAVFNASWM
jgi:hypothetical protein